MNFEFFDDDLDVRITQGALPHWYQPGVTYFITLRTDDSLPREVGEAWRRQRDDWLARHGIAPHAEQRPARLAQLPTPLRRAYHAQFTREYEDCLDRGYGACVLKRPELAREVAAGLRHFHRERCWLGDLVVMPNHVHLLVCLRGATDLLELCKSWKRYTARSINRALGQKGRFWQEESFDHLMRGAEQFARFRKYIADNPVRAGLRNGEFLYVRGDE
jgi:REP element-mobilizing transposase RayT